MMLAAQAGGELNAWNEELAKVGHYVNDQDWARVMLREQPEITKQLQDWE